MAILILYVISTCLLLWTLQSLHFTVAKNVKHIVIALALLSSSLTLYAQQASAEQCEEGKRICASFAGKDDTRYRRCVTTACSRIGSPSDNADDSSSSGDNSLHIPTIQDEGPEEEAPQTTVESCEVGSFKCNALRDEPLYYWRCMKTTCDSLTGAEDPSCEEGHDSCKFLLDGYWLCMSISCGTTIDSFETCSLGEDRCAPDLSKYWNCVAEECLGDVEEFRNPDPDAFDDNPYKDNITTSPAAAKRATSPFVLQGVRPSKRFPPKGIDPRIWARQGDPILSVKGSASRLFKCNDYTKSLACADTRDIATCLCADGTRPSARKEFRDINPPRKRPRGEKPLF